MLPLEFTIPSLSSTILYHTFSAFAIDKLLELHNYFLCNTQILDLFYNFLFTNAKNCDIMNLLCCSNHGHILQIKDISTASALAEAVF